MASFFRTFLKVPGPTHDVCYVSFTTVNGAAPTLVSGGSYGVTSVARSAEGVFLITLDKTYNFIQPVGLVVEAANLSHTPVVTAKTTSTVTLTLMAITDGTTADDDAGAIIHATFLCRAGV